MFPDRWFYYRLKGLTIRRKALYCTHIHLADGENQGDDIMKKKTLVVLMLVLCLASTSVFAAASSKTQLKFAVRPSTKMNVEVESSHNTTSHFTANLDADFAAIFNKGFGVYVVLNANFTGNAYGFLVGGAYDTKLNNNIDLFVTVGPSFMFSGSTTTIGAELMCNFDFKVTQDMFIRLGTGLDMDFVKIMKGGNNTTFTMNIPIPSLAIGWKF